MTTRLYLTRSEIFAAAWRRLRVERGAKATPAQHPAYWAAILRATWRAAKGDAFELLGINTYADEAARQSQAPRFVRQAARAAPLLQPLRIADGPQFRRVKAALEIRAEAGAMVKRRTINEILGRRRRDIWRDSGAGADAK